MRPPDTSNQFSASAQSLGYLYQGRLALFQMLQWPEDAKVHFEMDDDLDFEEVNGKKTLASLKHRRRGDRLTDLSVDFWRSMRIWVEKFQNRSHESNDLRFCILTTAEVPKSSVLYAMCASESGAHRDFHQLTLRLDNLLDSTTSSQILMYSREYRNLSDEQKIDLISRIAIIDNSLRITDIPDRIQNQHMRMIVREQRNRVFERLEGWWGDLVIKHLDGSLEGGVVGFEISDKLVDLAAEYTHDNLPITLQGASPESAVDIESDTRLFVHQLRFLGIRPSRIQNAILDYYRAFEQRSEWARENLLALGELEDFEARLIDEWSRYKDALLDEMDQESAESELAQIGKQLYHWAELDSIELSVLRIRPKVEEPFVIRGSYHILANSRPKPRIFWHPDFLGKLQQLLGVGK